MSGDRITGSVTEFVAYQDGVVTPFPDAVIVTARAAHRAFIARLAAKLPEPQRSAFLNGAGMFA